MIQQRLNPDGVLGKDLTVLRVFQQLHLPVLAARCGALCLEAEFQGQVTGGSPRLPDRLGGGDAGHGVARFTSRQHAGDRDRKEVIAQPVAVIRITAQQARDRRQPAAGLHAGNAPAGQMGSSVAGECHRHQSCSLLLGACSEGRVMPRCGGGNRGTGRDNPCPASRSPAVQAI